MYWTGLDCSSICLGWGSIEQKERKEVTGKRMSQHFDEQPLPLIEILENERLNANEEALKLLKTIPDDYPVSVVCVCGIYRSGKSSLMNWLLDIDTWSEQRNGFVVGPSINRCTRGIWMWGAPKKSKLPSGEECYVIVLDTEGIGGVESNAQYDARIFSLALLLCSSLIYNSMGSIDEAAISNLSFVAQLSQHIHISNKGEESDGREEVDETTSSQDDSLEFSRIFPSFTWVIRDFALGMCRFTYARIHVYLSGSSYHYYNYHHYHHYHH